MHETVIAKNIINEARKHGEVEEIYLEIGELAHVPAEELIRCLEVLVGWKIHHVKIPADVKCACGFEGHPMVLERGHDSFMIECPKCQSLPNLISGTDIKITKVAVK